MTSELNFPMQTITERCRYSTDCTHDFAGAVVVGEGEVDEADERTVPHFVVVRPGVDATAAAAVVARAKVRLKIEDIFANSGRSMQS